MKWVGKKPRKKSIFLLFYNFFFVVLLRRNIVLKLWFDQLPVFRIWSRNSWQLLCSLATKRDQARYDQMSPFQSIIFQRSVILLKSVNAEIRKRNNRLFRNKVSCFLRFPAVNDDTVLLVFPSLFQELLYHKILRFYGYWANS